MMKHHEKSDSELTESEFIEKYTGNTVTVEYLKARYAWMKNPTKENWLLACKAYEGTRACFLNREAQNTAVPHILPVDQLTLFK